MSSRRFFPRNSRFISSAAFGLLVRCAVVAATLVASGGRLNANPFTGPVFWLPPAHPTPYGTPLSSAQLNATLKDVPGVLTYEPAAGTVLPVGAHLLRVTLTPTDPKIAPYAAEVPLVVNPTDGPQIVLQPDVQTVVPGGAGTFAFRTNGAVTGWQWQKPRS